MRTIVLRKTVDPAAASLLKGGLAAVPTETVYGLSANGLDAAAVEKIYALKGRPPEKPVSLLVSGLDAAASFCRNVPPEAGILADAFWPGPLTMILEKSDLVPDIVTAGGATVGIRCPDHPLTLELLRACGVPLATPSANLSGGPSPKTAEEVLAVFRGKIPYVIDGGPCAVGTESTIVDLTVSPPRILRQGGLPRRAIEEVLGTEVRT